MYQVQYIYIYEGRLKESLGPKLHTMSRVKDDYQVVRYCPQLEISLHTKYECSYKRLFFVREFEVSHELTGLEIARLNVESTR